MIEQIADVARRDVSRETFERLELYARRLGEAAEQQNLVSANSLANLWDRHVIDSAQLIPLAPQYASWADIGAGAGLPGVIVAILTEAPVTLIEPRRLRAEFLSSIISELALEKRVRVEPVKAEKVSGEFDVLSARAVTNVGRLLDISTHLSTKNSIWVLPKGRNAGTELEEARRRWHIDADSVPSRTDPESTILVLRRVSAKGKR